MVNYPFFVSHDLEVHSDKEYIDFLEKELKKTKQERNIALRWLKVIDNICSKLQIKTDGNPDYQEKIILEKLEQLSK